MYNFNAVKDYWRERIIGGEAELNTVLSYNEMSIVNSQYDIWEKEVIGKIIGNLSKKKVLDIPCGIGRWTEHLVTVDNEVTCVDCCNEIVDILQKKFKGTDFKIKYIVDNIEKIDLPKKAYDVILCTGLYEHLPKEIYMKVTKALASSLRGGGKIILVINNANSRFLSKKEDNQYRLDKQLDNGYFCGVTQKECVIDILENNGIDIKNYSINPCYSIMRQLVKKSSYEEGVLKRLFECACKTDIESFKFLNNCESFDADQIIIYGEKKNGL